MPVTIPYGLAKLMLPTFNTLVTRQQSFPMNLTLEATSQGMMFLSLVGLALIVGIIAGSYPAFFYRSLHHPVGPAMLLYHRPSHGFSFRISPIVYYTMNAWLQDFVYRIQLGIWPFLLGGVLSLVIAMLTVSSQTVRAAISNPVDALRYE